VTFGLVYNTGVVGVEGQRRRLEDFAVSLDLRR
jgi:hypothetical protein